MTNVNIDTSYSMECSTNHSVSVKFAILYRNASRVECASDISSPLHTTCSGSNASNQCTFAFSSLLDSNDSSDSSDICINDAHSMTADIGVFCIPPLQDYDHVTPPIDDDSCWSLGISPQLLLVIVGISVLLIIALALSFLLWHRRSTHSTATDKFQPLNLSQSATSTQSTSAEVDSGDSGPGGTTTTYSTAYSGIVPFNSGESHSVKEQDVRNRMKSHPAVKNPNGAVCDYHNVPTSSASTGSRGSVMSPIDTLSGGHRQSPSVALEDAELLRVKTPRMADIPVPGIGGRSVAILPGNSTLIKMQRTHSTKDQSQETSMNTSFGPVVVITDKEQLDHAFASPLEKQRSRTLSARKMPIVQPRQSPGHSLNQSNNVEISELIRDNQFHPLENDELAHVLMYPQYESTSFILDDEGNEGEDERRQHYLGKHWQQYYGQPPPQHPLSVPDELVYDLSNTNNRITNGDVQMDRIHVARRALTDPSTNFHSFDESKIECITEDEVHLEAVIGRGQSLNSKVFRARWRNTQCAAKRFPKTWSNASKCRQYIDQIAIKLVDHPHENVVKLLAFHFEPFTLLSEFMNVGSAKDYTKSTRLGASSISILDRIELCNGIAKGIQHLHSLDIVHSEINAQHLLVDIDNESKAMRVAVTDYALQMMLTKSELDTHRSTAGVVQYLAPECFPDPQAEDSAPSPPTTKESDIYALGITMWEVITGQEPYRDLAPVEAAVHVLVKERRPQSFAFIPETIQNLMRKCWHKEREERPSADTVVAELTKFIESERKEMNDHYID